MEVSNKRLKLEFIGTPDIKEAVGKGKTAFTLPGSTLGDLLESLKEKYGPAIKKSLLDANGFISGHIQVLLNGEAWVPRDNLAFQFNDGDQLLFIAMMAGG